MTQGVGRKVLRMSLLRFLGTGRDVSKDELWNGSHVGMDFGPYYGIDYARFSDEANPRVDDSLRDRIFHQLCFDLNLDTCHIRVYVRNGFVFLTFSAAIVLDRERIRSSLHPFGEIISLEIFQETERRTK